MEQRSGGTTSPALLDRLRDVGDHPAWVEFVERYEPLMRRWCRSYGLDDQAADELCLRTWERLWPRMRTFQYDPSRRFRSWLRRFFHSRAVDLLSERAETAFVPLDAVSSEESSVLDFGRDDVSMEDGEHDDECQSSRPVLIREGKEVQEFVQAQVDPATWQAFWLTTIAIESLTVKEVASAQGKSYAAVYYGVQRVKRMLRQEGERRLDSLTSSARQSSE